VRLVASIRRMPSGRIGEADETLVGFAVMAVTSTVLDGNNVALAYASGTAFANVLALNTTTGAVTSSYLPAEWCQALTDNARALFRVTSVAQRQTVQFLDRLVAIGSLDGATISTSASLGAGTATLVVSVSADTTLLVQLPHSIFGAASLGQSVPATGGGGGGTVVPGDLGLVRWTGTVAGTVNIGELVAADGLTGQLIPADKAVALALPALGVYELDSALAPCVRTSGEAAAAVGGPFPAGATIYVGTAGAATATNPSTPGENRQVIGFATSAGTLFVQPGFVTVVA
jgi:hypothetical protein